MKTDLGIQQMDCPETLYIGIQRWWHTKNLYDNVGFRRQCREIAERQADYMEEYRREGYKVVGVLGCDGSPTCGVTITAWDENWGGSPVNLSFNDAIIEGEGVYIEELKKPSKNAVWTYLRSMDWHLMMNLPIWSRS